ncbi:hypothetical protein PAXRUDRAFT_243790 [Paxillus rubicundulus Ve08.2h10]|uniref:C2H2-type domain-containing protein n=1 Tax=Paxillus rubicundulus Ve08.2h10 TaxID=930991 RepID=A0A0D0EB81_9AGAM|nr:hypothetical protein PAXRUDRAFT_243790 [Paxillus rubicundulus Ve08.2h10]
MDAANPFFTCLSCSIAFASPEDQRTHYRSDHHRYNMKRRVASLPPVSAAVFNQKVLERRQETAVTSSSKGLSCDLCGSHINSKKHKENKLSGSQNPQTHHVDHDDLQDEMNRAIDAKIAAARSKLSPSSCLFCTHSSLCLEGNLSHMSSSHSFFIPDAEYLIDITGLITYLGEKIAVGNVCIYCNGKGRELRSLGAVRKHMIDKAHCKIAYGTANEKLEISDYYDFTSSYPTESDGKNEGNRMSELPDDGAWEDVKDGEYGDEEVDEVVDDVLRGEEDDPETLPDNQLTYGDTEYELVLPSGARIGHRSMKRYYSQSFHGVCAKEEDSNTGAGLVRRLLADKNSALVPRKGGFGAFGQGTEVVKARNKGEAREAGRHIREFRDQRRREDFKTKVAFIHNSQKHFRDPLLQ